MRLTRASFFSLLFMISTTALASSKSSVVLKGNEMLSIFDNGTCAEIQRIDPKSIDSGWKMRSSGGYTWDELEGSMGGFSKGRMQVNIGNSQISNYELVGRQFVPQSLISGMEYSITNERYFSGKGDYDDAVVIGFTGAGPKSFVEIKNSKGYSNIKYLLSAAFIHINQNPYEFIPNVTCDYVAGDIDLGDVESGKCVWVDGSSRTSNGRPYCL